MNDSNEFFDRLFELCDEWKGSKLELAVMVLKTGSAIAAQYSLPEKEINHAVEQGIRSVKG